MQLKEPVFVSYLPPHNRNGLDANVSSTVTSYRWLMVDFLKFNVVSSIVNRIVSPNSHSHNIETPLSTTNGPYEKFSSTNSISCQDGEPPSFFFEFFYWKFYFMQRIYNFL